MGTTAEKLTYLNETKGLLKDSINSLGGDITSQTTFRQYATELDSIYASLPKVSGTGSNISLSPTLKGRLGSVLKGNTLQDGTPTPDSPVEIQSATGLQNINVCGKNLFDGLWTSPGVSTNFIPVVANQHYKYSENGVAEGMNYRFYETMDGNYEQTYVSNLNSFTPTKNGYIILYKTTHSESGCQLEVGTEATSYEAYQSQEYEINLGTIELNKIGDYQDRIYKDNDKWYEEKQIGKVVLDGSIYISTTIHTDLYFIYTTALYVEYIIGGYSSHFGFENNSNIINNDTAENNLSDNQIAFRLGNSKDRLYIKSSQFTSTTDLKEWLETNRPTLYYVLATPTYTEITNTELIEQLNAFYNAKSYNGQTNISVEGDLPMILDVSALKGE